MPTKIAGLCVIWFAGMASPSSSGKIALLLGLCLVWQSLARSDCWDVHNTTYICVYTSLCTVYVCGQLPTYDQGLCHIMAASHSNKFHVFRAKTSNMQKRKFRMQYTNPLGKLVQNK